MRWIPLVSLAMLGVSALGCASAVVPPKPPPIVIDPPGTTFELEAFKKVDRANDWTAANCKDLSGQFAHFADSDPYVPALHYDLGIIHERCGDEKAALEDYRVIVGRVPDFSEARVRFALLLFADGGENDMDRSIDQLSRAVVDSKYQNLEALTELARLEMRRDHPKMGSELGDHDLAYMNLKRALAVNDASMSAYNLLALLYLQDAEKLPAAEAKPAFELALLVTSQAIRKNADYAPIYNTAGLVYSAMGDSTNAADQFDKARTLDPKFFEAHMNFAELNLGFRGFAKAEPAFRIALKLRPNDYDAHLGLALALVGLIDDSNYESNYRAAKGELERAIAIDAKRPEAYFNEASLEEKFGAKLPGDEGLTAFSRAKSGYERFVKIANGDPRFAERVDDVTARSTKRDKDCMGPSAASDHACKKGKLQYLDEILEFNAQSLLRAGPGAGRAS
jgi:tetratricopeptide (TPR) repeat protein